MLPAPGRLLGDLRYKGAIAYIDDIVLYAEPFQQFKDVLGKTLDRIRQAGLRLKPEKCSFAMKELPLLGFVVDEMGIKPNPNKIEQ